MAVSHVEAVTEALAALAAWEAQNVADLDATLEALPSLGAYLQVAYSRIAGTLREEGISTVVADILDEAGQAGTTIIELSRLAYETHRREHSFWLGG